MLEITETVLLARRRPGLRRTSPRCASSASGSPSTTSAPATRRCRLPAAVRRSTSSRSTGPSSTGSASPSSRPALVEAIVRWPTLLDLEVVAEGIETPSSATSCGQLGCGLGQGYLFARPLSEPTAGPSPRSARRRDSPRRTPPSRASTPDRTPAPLRRRIDRITLRRGPLADRDARVRTIAGTTARPWADLDAPARGLSPMYDAVIDEIAGGGSGSATTGWPTSRPATTWASTSNRRSSPRSSRQLRRWGTHPSWSRLLGSPRLYPDIEERLTELLGAPDTLVLPTITHIHMSVIPVLAGAGGSSWTAQAHKTIYDGCMVAARAGRDHAPVPGRRPRPALDRRAAAPRRAASRKLVCIDGVNSMTGNLPDLPALRRGLPRARRAALRRRRARLRRASASAAPTRPSPVRHAGQRDRAPRRARPTTTSSWSAASPRRTRRCWRSSPLPTWLKNHLKVAAPPYLYSGPSPMASLATVLAGLRRQRGARRRHPRRPPPQDRAGARPRSTSSGSHTPNVTGTPIIEMPLAAGRRPRSGRPVPVGRRHLRHAGRVPAGARAPRSASASRSPRPTPTRRSTSCSPRSPRWPSVRLRLTLR